VTPEVASLDETLCSIRFAEQVNQTELGQAKARVTETTKSKGEASSSKSAAAPEPKRRRSIKKKASSSSKRKKRGSSSKKVAALAASLNIDPSRIGKAPPSRTRRRTAAEAAANAPPAVAVLAEVAEEAMGEEEEEEEEVADASELTHATLARPILAHRRPSKRRRKNLQLVLQNK
tara:strand:- start:14 stop:541 length:528 start_codon:yes stop_codon:yes gene_type:complete